MIKAFGETLANNRVLVVDDDHHVINTYLETLESKAFELGDFDFIAGTQSDVADVDEVLHFEVDTADNGEDALERVRSAVERDAPYAVAFLDMRMPPGWDGLETARELRKLDDNIYIVFVTAYSDHSVDEMQGALIKNTLLINKPFRGEVIKQIARTFCINWARERCLLETQERLRNLSEKMAHQASHDALTGLHNRYYLDQHLDIEVRRARREQQPISLLMVDIDWFKRFNDHNGHTAGDEALSKIAGAIRSAVQRPGDFVARFGGEEFCVVLPNTDRPGAETVAEHLRVEVERLKIEFGDDDNASIPYLTVSTGGVSRVPLTVDKGSALIEEADHLLYCVKRSGKNSVLVKSGS